MKFLKYQEFITTINNQNPLKLIEFITLVTKPKISQYITSNDIHRTLFFILDIKRNFNNWTQVHDISEGIFKIISSVSPCYRSHL